MKLSFLRPIGLLCLFSICLVFTSQAQTHIEAAKLQLIKNKSFKNLSPENLDLISSHTSEQSGLTHMYFNQTLGGIYIYNAISNVAIDRSGQIVFTGDRIVDSSNPTNKTVSISATEAVNRAGRHFNLDMSNNSKIVDQKNQANQETTIHNQTISKKDIKTELMYVVNDGTLILTWSVIFEKADDQFWWDTKINASDGSIVEKTSWTIECNFSNNEDACDHQSHDHSIHTQTFDSSPNRTLIHYSSSIIDGDYFVSPMPDESPNHGPLSIVNSPWNNNLDPDAYPFEWHNDGGNTYSTTRGNNVWAVEDINQDNNQNNGPSPNSQLNNAQQYNFTPDFNQTPSTYKDAATVNLFYWNNIVHDVTYHFGFDEAAGNFQESNATGNGLGSDAVLADAQDGSDTGNARFFLQPEGSNPRMEMYEWQQPPSSQTPNVTISGSISLATIGIQANFTPAWTSSANGTLVLVTDTGGTNEACGTPTPGEISNTAALNGNVALIDRGNCNFTEKIENAQATGAISVVVCQNTGDNPFAMGGTPANPINIPAIMISMAACNTIKAALPGITISFNPDVGVPNRDSDYDNGIIAHEYAHGISTRLTGGAATIGCLTGDEQMGEGWSDYFGLILTIKPGDTGPKVRGIGTYVRGEPTNGNGIRPFPYSNDFEVNPMTYATTGSGVSIPHGVGSVWCTMLWDMTWKFIDLYGLGTNIYDSDINNVGTPASPGTFGGQNLALMLIMEGMKLQPCNPGFVDGRDAILAADQAIYGGIHKSLIWEVFANRGLGVSAEQGSSASVADNIEAFDLPSLTIEKTASVIMEVDRNTMSYDITVATEHEVQDNVILTDVIDPSLEINSVVCPSPASHSISGNTVTITHPSLGLGQQFTCTIHVTINTGSNLTTQNLLFEDVESIPSQMTVNTILGPVAEEWETTNSAAQSPINSWFVENTNGPDKFTTLESPTLTLGATPILSFYHQFNTESGWDGGFIEVSTNNGVSWNTVDPAAFLLNGYNSVLGTNDNTFIAEKAAWSGNSGGFIKSILDLGAFANTASAKIRFSYGQDDNTNNAGWWIDDISLDENFEQIENIACVTSDQIGNQKCDDASILVELIGDGTCNLLGMPCDDLNDCTDGETYDTSCNCTNGTFQDEDNDGVCDAEDVCTGFDDTLIGTSCEDGDPCTEGEIYNNSCNCVNGIFQDADNDGVCDAEDVCAGFDDTLIGTSCEDGDPCTEGEIYNNSCNCVNGTFQDADNDGVCDAEDVCAGFDDMLIGTSCDDGDPCTEGETFDGTCNCSNGIFQDADNDGICDANDNDCITLEFDNFESGPGIWQGGGNDAELVNSTNSPGGDFSFLIRDNSGINSSITSSILDLSAVNLLEVTFLYNAVGMETGKSFLLEFSDDGGANFAVVQEWVSGADFANNVVIMETVDLSSQSLSTTSVIRFRCNANINADEVYLDNILIDSCPADCQVQSACDDGDPCTEGETLDANCNCTNGIFQDEDSDGICDANDNDCVTIEFDDFESGPGVWQDGGGDADLINSGNSPGGSSSFMIRDNSGINSSITSTILDLSAVDILQVTFSFNAVGMETGKSFFLELSIDGGSNFSIVQEWVSGTDFVNDQVYIESLDFANQPLSSTTLLRFRCNGTINSDQIFLDNILIDNCPSDCEDFIVDSSNAIVPVSQRANIGVTSNAIINTSSNIEFNGGEFVLMTEGFEVKSQAEFHAFIEACSNQ